MERRHGQETPRVASLKRVIAASRFGSGLPHVSGGEDKVLIRGLSLV